MTRTGTQLAILKVASDTFRKYGYNKTSLSEIAKAAGVSRQAIYLNFQDKETLFRLAFEYELDANLELVSGALGTSENALQAITEAFHVWHGQYVSRGQRLEREGIKPPVHLSAEIIQRTRSDFLCLLATYIGKSSAVQALNNTEIDSDALAEMLLIASRGVLGFVGNEVEYCEKMSLFIRTILNLAPSTES